MADKRWRVREYRSGDETAILALFNQVFGAESETFQPRTMEFWKWQFEQNPLGHHSVVAEADDGSLVGNYGGIRVPFLHNGQRIVATQGVDTCLRADYRGSGLFADLNNTFVECFVTSGRDLMQYGYPHFAHMRSGVRRSSYAPIYSPMDKLVKDFDAGWIDTLDRCASGLAAEELPALDDRVDTLWDRVRVDHTFAIWRERPYLHWRYERHPSIRYRYLATSDASGALSGLLVICLGWFGHPIVPLVDWLVRRGDRAVLAALIAAAARITLDAGGKRLEAWAPPGSPERQDLVSLGFVTEETPFHLTLTALPAGFTVEWLREHWFYTMGDADMY